ncbi:MAG: cysteine desulfurase NifS [Minisyncoccus archaeiphilus]|uniref:cysteine desulfurase family protein n=1 Tax=Minisyncoccus archaeiphilus TaxID=3238481 RepID=UPI002B077834|nr:MAG: cysteine desulfurase NifS [Candidatus Parcubacteria bacterium]
MKDNKYIYVDHSATTPVDPRVLEVMLPYFGQKYGNYSSLHGLGREAYFAVEGAREVIAKHLDCHVDEVIFTSGSTESNNLALKGVIGKLGQGVHIITTQVEHDSILNPCKQLEKKGVEVTYLPVCKDGTVDPEVVSQAIKDNTVLVSVMYVNNELGSINPIKEIGEAIKKKNSSILFHCDATQAVNYLDCRVSQLGVDMMSISSHKIYGPKGVGLIYIKKGVKLDAIQSGGHQEKGLRSGTLNVPGIIGFGKAMDITILERDNNIQKIIKLRDRFVNQVKIIIPDIILNTVLDKSVCSHANFCFVGAEGESVLMYLDIEGVAVSTGSACASGSLDPSHVLLAIGVPKEIAHSSIRFTFGKNNTEEELNHILEVLPIAVKKLRDMNPLYNKG